MVKPNRTRLPASRILLYSMVLLPVYLTLAGAPAQAQNSINIKRDQLEQVEPYHARRHIMIVDECPRVVDYRRPKDNGPNYLINVGPVPSSGGQPNTVILTPEHNGLTQSGFQSQIPAGGMIKPALAPVVMGGHAPVQGLSDGGKSASARPIMATSARLGQQSPAASAPMQYHKYDTAGGNSFESHSSTQTKAKLHGKLINTK